MKPKECFIAGTPVLAEHGLVAIEEIRVGDLVWSKGVQDAPPTLRRVVEIFETPDQKVYEVDVATESGILESLGTTQEHPFWVDGLGWVPASRQQRKVFLADKGVELIEDPKGLSRSKEFQALFRPVAKGQGRGDAALVTFANELEIEAFTANSKILRFLDQSLSPKARVVLKTKITDIRQE